MTGLARLLAASLQGIDGPAQLRQLADENAGPTPKYLTVQDFSRALAFFERPGRTDILRDVALRLAAVPRAPTGPEAEIQKLRERLTVAENKDPEEKPGARPRTTRSREFVIVAGISVVSVAVLAVGPRLRAGISAEGMTPRWAVAALAHATPGRPTLDATKDSRLKAKTAPRAAGAPPGHASPARPRHDGIGEAPAARVSRTSTIDPGVLMPVDPGASEPYDQVVPRAAPPVLSSAPAPAPAARRSARAVTRSGNAAAGPVEFEARIVYSNADPEVEPAGLMRPQLPKVPPPGADTGYFDIIVDEAGNVEFIDLVSPAHRYQDRMLIAAAKAWKFRPAMLDGQPVEVPVAHPHHSQRSPMIGGGRKPHFLLPLLRQPSGSFVLSNERTGLTVATVLETAFDSASRNRGLLGRSHLPREHALILAPSNVVHTFFMQFPIDLLFVARDGRALKSGALSGPAASSDPCAHLP